MGGWNAWIGGQFGDPEQVESDMAGFIVSIYVGLSVWSGTGRAVASKREARQGAQPKTSGWVKWRRLRSHFRVGPRTTQIRVQATRLGGSRWERCRTPAFEVDGQRIPAQVVGHRLEHGLGSTDIEVLELEVPSTALARLRESQKLALTLCAERDFATAGTLRELRELHVLGNGTPPSSEHSP